MKSYDDELFFIISISILQSEKNWHLISFVLAIRMRSFPHLQKFLKRISSVVHHPDHPTLIRRLLHAFMNYWVDQYPERRIERIYAETVSEDGKQMANELRMPIMYTVVDGRLERVKNALQVS
jgi:hypothetical protein